MSAPIVPGSPGALAEISLFAQGLGLETPTALTGALGWLGLTGLVGMAATLVVVRRWDRAERSRRARLARQCAHLGWRVEHCACGLTISGRSMSRRWHLQAQSSELGVGAAMGCSASGVVTFTLGAPDLSRTLAMVCAHAQWSRAQQRAPQFFLTTRRHRVGTDALRQGFRIHAENQNEAQRLLSHSIERLLIRWPSRLGLGPDKTLQIWICPHGVQVVSTCGLNDWVRLRHVIRIGLEIGRRAGFA